MVPSGTGYRTSTAFIGAVIIVVSTTPSTGTSDTVPQAWDNETWVNTTAHRAWFDSNPVSLLRLIKREALNGKRQDLWTWTHPQEGRAAAALARPLRTQRRVAHGGKVDWG